MVKLIDVRLFGTFVLPLTCAVLLAMAGRALGEDAKPAAKVTGVPIEVSGWNQDVIFEATPKSSITTWFAPDDKMTWPETGKVAGVTCTGFPASRTLTTDAGTVFAFQPYTEKNAFWLRGQGWMTATLATPRKYSSISLLHSSAGFHQHWQKVTIKLTFTDHPKVELLWLPDIGVPVGRTMTGPTWGDNAKETMGINRVSHPSLTASLDNPVKNLGGKWRIFETQIPLTPHKSTFGLAQDEHLENFTLSAIEIGKNACGNEVQFACFAISGVPADENQAPAVRTGGAGDNTTVTVDTTDKGVVPGGNVTKNTPNNDAKTDNTKDDGTAAGTGEDNSVLLSVWGADGADSAGIATSTNDLIAQSGDYGSYKGGGTVYFALSDATAGTLGQAKPCAAPFTMNLDLKSPDVVVTKIEFLPADASWQQNAQAKGIEIYLSNDKAKPGTKIASATLSAAATTTVKLPEGSKGKYLIVKSSNNNGNPDVWALGVVKPYGPKKNQ